MAMADRAAKRAAQEEKARREKERAEFKQAQELESLRRKVRKFPKFRRLSESPPNISGKFRINEIGILNVTI